MTICEERSLCVLFVPIIMAWTVGCGYQIGRVSPSVESVNYSFDSAILLPPVVESRIREGVWQEVQRRTRTGGECTLDISVIRASSTPSLGTLSNVELEIGGTFGQGEPLLVDGRRSFTVTSPESSEEMRLDSYEELARTLTSDLLLRLLTDGEHVCH